MAVEPQDSNILRSEGQAHSRAAGDVPDDLRRRYFVDGRGGRGLGFYADAQVEVAVFRDQGRRLVAVRTDPNAIRDMTVVARHRGWAIVVVQGERDFRREAWLAGQMAGLEVRGYRPTERDQQDLARRLERRDGRRDTAPGQRAPTRVSEDPGVRSRLQIVDAVVRARVADPVARARIVDAARGRLADWLERGARFNDLATDRAVRRGPERARAR